MQVRESWRNVGRKVRYLRKAHQLTIKQLAAGCGLSSNAISLVERGQVAPTVTTLCKIASALGVPASYFFQEVCPNEVVLTRARDYRAHQPVDQALGALACGVAPQNRLSLANLDDLAEDAGASYSHEFVLCLSGQIEYEANGKRYRLEAGDSLSFNGNVLHRWKNLSSDTAVVAMVLHPESIPGSEEGE